MKSKLLIAVLLVLPALIAASDVSVQYKDSITASDSVAVRIDTAFTPTVYVGNKEGFQFFPKVSAYTETQYANDTNWTDDSLFIKVQFSFDLSTWVTFEVDTLLDNGSGTLRLTLLRNDSTLFGDWMRGLLIHHDSIGVGEADSALVNGPAYYKFFELFYTTW